MKNFAIICGNTPSEIQRRAIEELSATLLEYTLEYPLCLTYGETVEDHRPIYIGTRESNPYIAALPSEPLSRPEEYRIEVKDSVTVIEGYDDAGVLYGALDFYNKYILRFEHPDNDKCDYCINFLLSDPLPDFSLRSAPSVRERGLWSWGHVIYDYKKYLDNMMRLKMNAVIIWNDFAPFNGDEIVDYAHARNIKVYWGFSWGWDNGCANLDITNLEGLPERTFEKYKKEYASMKGDGIYFQTFTEVWGDNIGGVLIAKAATDFVNRTASIFYENYPELEIQFGLHAMSVWDRLDLIAHTDPRIRIVWEDCGAFPFSYIPKDLSSFSQTEELVDRIAVLRGADDRFGVVTKGLVKLDWPSFKHLQGPQWMGVSNDTLKANRIERKRKIWRYIQAGWMTYGEEAYRMIQRMYRAKGGDLIATALVEDGMFEEQIMFPVALYSEMLWDCESDIKTLTHGVALRGYVTYA